MTLVLMATSGLLIAGIYGVTKVGAALAKTHGIRQFFGTH